MTLPQDPMILLSLLNMKLRDGGASLQALCDELGADPEEIREKLAAAGYRYDEKANRFR